MKKIVAVIDAGGRGSVLVDAYAKSPFVGKVLAIPGNECMKTLSQKKILTYPHIATVDVEKIVTLCKKKNVSLVDVAQDNAIASGLVDALEKAKIPVLGPRKNAGELEWNKAFSREFGVRHTLPQPDFFIFHSVKEGIDFLRKQPQGMWFVKASGLCDGKGALGATSNEAAIEKIKEIQKFGNAGKTYLLERWLISDKGLAEEFSAFFITDGRSCKLIGFAQDHKRAYTFDEGENTGGMGCTSSPAIVTASIQKQTEAIAMRTIMGLQKEGRIYVGILYIGGIIVRQKNKRKVFLIEFNARWGDPEAEVLIPGLHVDMYLLAQAVIQGKLQTFPIQKDKKIRVVVAGVAKGYPKDYAAVKNKEIFGLHAAAAVPHVVLFPAGIARRGTKHFVKGGRIFYLVGEGKDVLCARGNVYKALSCIFIEGNNLYYRIDIGWHDMQKQYLS